MDLRVPEIGVGLLAAGAMVIASPAMAGSVAAGFAVNMLSARVKEQIDGWSRASTDMHPDVAEALAAAYVPALKRLEAAWGTSAQRKGLDPRSRRASNQRVRKWMRELRNRKPQAQAVARAISEAQVNASEMASGASMVEATKRRVLAAISDSDDIGDAFVEYLAVAMPAAWGKAFLDELKIHPSGTRAYRALHLEHLRFTRNALLDIDKRDQSQALALSRVEERIAKMESEEASRDAVLEALLRDTVSKVEKVRVAGANRADAVTAEVKKVGDRLGTLIDRILVNQAKLDTVAAIPDQGDLLRNIRGSSSVEPIQLQELVALAESKQELLIHGPPGSGKTVLTAWLHEHFEAKGRSTYVFSASFRRGCVQGAIEDTIRSLPDDAIIFIDDAHLCGQALAGFAHARKQRSLVYVLRSAALPSITSQRSLPESILAAMRKGPSTNAAPILEVTEDHAARTTHELLRREFPDDEGARARVLDRTGGDLVLVSWILEQGRSGATIDEIVLQHVERLRARNGSEAARAVMMLAGPRSVEYPVTGFSVMRAFGVEPATLDQLVDQGEVVWDREDQLVLACHPKQAHEIARVAFETRVLKALVGATVLRKGFEDADVELSSSVTAYSLALLALADPSSLASQEAALIPTGFARISRDAAVALGRIELARRTTGIVGGGDDASVFMRRIGICHAIVNGHRRIRAESYPTPQELLRFWSDELDVNLTDQASEKLGDAIGSQLGYLFYQIGYLSFLDGDLDEAERLFKKSSDADREWASKNASVRPLHRAKAAMSEHMVIRCEHERLMRQALSGVTKATETGFVQCAARHARVGVELKELLQRLESERSDSGEQPELESVALPRQASRPSSSLALSLTKRFHNNSLICEAESRAWSGDSTCQSWIASYVASEDPSPSVLASLEERIAAPSYWRDEKWDEVIARLLPWWSVNQEREVGEGAGQRAFMLADALEKSGQSSPVDPARIWKWLANDCLPYLGNRMFVDHACERLAAKRPSGSLQPPGEEEAES